MIHTLCRRAGPRSLVSAIVFLALSLSSPVSARAAGLGVRAAMLPAKDVPAGLHLGAHSFLSNAEAARVNHVNVSVMNAMGRVQGYQAQYALTSGHRPPSGIFYLATHVVEYRSPAGAAKGFRYYQARNRRIYGGYLGFTEFSSPSGKAWAITYACQCKNGETISDEATEHVGRYYVDVQLGYIAPRSATPKTATAMLDRTVHLMSVIARRVH